MNASAFCATQRALLQIEYAEEQAGLADKLQSLGAQECEAEGLSLLSLQLQSVRTGIYGRSVITLVRNCGSSGSGSSIKTGDEVKVYNPQLRSTPQAAQASFTGVVLKSSSGGGAGDDKDSKKTRVEAGAAAKTASAGAGAGIVIEVAVSGEEEVDEALLSSGSLRLDLLANDATHKKMLLALDDLESVARTGSTASRRGAGAGAGAGGGAGCGRSPAATLVNLLFGSAYARAQEKTAATHSKGKSGASAAGAEIEAAAQYSTVTDQAATDTAGLLWAGCSIPKKMSQAGSTGAAGYPTSIKAFGPINSSQVSAIENALQSPLLACIHGPPGTGKSTAVVELILQLVARGQRVLVCAPSNVAVDSLVERLSPSALSKMAAAGAAQQQQQQQQQAERQPQERQEGQERLEQRGGKKWAHGNSDTSKYGNDYLPGTSTSAQSALPMPAPRIVRLGHPARMSQLVWPHCLEALLASSDDASILSDVRSELNAVRQAAYGGGGGGRGRGRGDSKDREKEEKGGKKRKDAAGGGGIDTKHMGFGQLKSELKTLRKELRQREEASVGTLLKSRDVVLCTTVGAGNKLLAKVGVEFDVVIIDEAAQALEASCWIPLLLGKKAVLAGDHKQLAPTIKSSAAEAGGLGVTLFQRILEDSYSSVENVATGDVSGAKDKEEGKEMGLAQCGRLLDTQYRMNALICNWASEAVYSGKLLSHASVAQHTLAELTNLGAAPAPTAAAEEGEEDDPSADVLLLVDTAGCDLYEDAQTADSSARSAAGKKGSAALKKASSSNMHEALLVQRQVRALVYGSYEQADRCSAGVPVTNNGKTGLAPEKIGVITPYNGQVDVLWALLGSEFPTLDVRTVDAFQGGEKEAIVISMVRSNLHATVGFLSDQRRINVAVTRAKRHLCIVCDTATISTGDPTPTHFLRGLLTYMSEHGNHRCATEWAEGRASSGEKPSIMQSRQPKSMKSAAGKDDKKDSISGATGKDRKSSATSARDTSQQDLVVLQAEKLIDFLLAGQLAGENQVSGTGVGEGEGEGEREGEDEDEGCVELVLLPSVLPHPATAVRVEPPAASIATMEPPSLLFPAALDPYIRARIHEYCERRCTSIPANLSLRSASEGAGSLRRLRVTLVPATSSSPTTPSEKVSVAKKEKEQKPLVQAAAPAAVPQTATATDSSSAGTADSSSSSSSSASYKQFQPSNQPQVKRAQEKAQAQQLARTEAEALAVVQRAAASRPSGANTKATGVTGTGPGGKKLGGAVRPALEKSPFAAKPAPELTAATTALNQALVKEKKKKEQEAEDDDEEEVLELAMKSAQLERDAIKNLAHERQYRVPLRPASTGAGTAVARASSEAMPNPDTAAAVAAMRQKQVELAEKRKSGNNTRDAGAGTMGSGSSSGSSSGRKLQSTSSANAEKGRRDAAIAARAKVAKGAADPKAAEEAEAGKKARVSDVLAAARERTEAKALARSRALAAAEAREAAAGRGGKK